MKGCKRCQRVLPLTAFYPHPQMRDRLLNVCKDCKRAEARLNSRSERARAYDRRRAGGRIAPRDPVKARAQKLIHRLVRSGRLIREPCVVCGTTTGIQAHHHAGYEGENAATVTWLCREHHGEAHRLRTFQPTS